MLFYTVQGLQLYRVVVTERNQRILKLSQYEMFPAQFMIFQGLWQRSLLYVFQRRMNIPQSFDFLQSLAPMLELIIQQNEPETPFAIQIMTKQYWKTKVNDVYSINPIVAPANNVIYQKEYHLRLFISILKNPNEIICRNLSQLLSNGLITLLSQGIQKFAIICKTILIKYIIDVAIDTPLTPITSPVQKLARVFFKCQRKKGKVFQESNAPDRFELVYWIIYLIQERSVFYRYTNAQEQQKAKILSL
eukprot:403337821